MGRVRLKYNTLDFLFGYDGLVESQQRNDTVNAKTIIDQYWTAPKGNCYKLAIKSIQRRIDNPEKYGSVDDALKTIFGHRLRI